MSKQIENLAHEISFNALRILKGKMSFYHWFDKLDEEIQTEIYDSIKGMVIEKVEIFENGKRDQ